MKYLVIFLSVGLSLLSLTSNAQNARVQFIHNSADTSLQFVDIYWNGNLLFDNFSFHQSSAFLNREGGEAAVISVAEASSTSADDAFSVLEFTPEPAGKYLVILQGLREEMGYEVFAPFEINIISEVREVAANPSAIDLLIVNGSVDAGTMNIDELELLQIPFVEDLDYGDNSDYLSVLSGSYQFRLTRASDQEVLGVFHGNFPEYNLIGMAVTLVISGFENPSLNNGGELLSMWMAKPTGGMMTEFQSPKSAPFFLHNSADTDLAEVDVYWNGRKVLDNLNFRQASPRVMKRYTGSSVEIALAPANSSSSADIIFSKQISLNNGDSSAYLISGLSHPENYSNYKSLELGRIAFPLEESDNPDEIAVTLINGMSDLDNFRLANDDASTLLSNAAYNQIKHFSITEETQSLVMRNSDSSFEIRKFAVPEWGSGSDLHFILASGFYNPELNNNGPEFGLWSVSGPDSDFLELTAAEDSYTNVMLVNNSCDQSLAQADIYINRKKVLSSFSFPASTSLEVKSNADAEIAVVPAGEQFENSVYRQTHLLNSENSYLWFFNGIAQTSAYNPAPQATITSFVEPFVSSENNQERLLLFYNGSTDTGALHFAEMTEDIALESSLGFGEISNTHRAVTSAEEAVLRIESSLSGFVFGDYSLPASDPEGENISSVIFTRGFWNPANNSGGEGFGVWMLKSDGSITQLSKSDFVEVSNVERLDYVSAYPNPATDFLYLSHNEKVLSSGDSFCVYSLSGEKCREGIWQGKLDVSSLASGLYLMRIGEESIRFSVR